MTTDLSADTWAAVLLDGFLGALVGAAATIAVVVATIRNEASMRRRDRLEDVVATAHAEAMAFGFTIQSDDKISAASTSAALNRMLQTYITATARAQHLEPKLHQMLEVVSEDITEALQTFDGSADAVLRLRRICFLAQAVLARWITNPDEIRNDEVSIAGLKKLADPATIHPSQ